MVVVVVEVAVVVVVVVVVAVVGGGGGGRVDGHSPIQGDLAAFCSCCSWLILDPFCFGAPAWRAQQDWLDNPDGTVEEGGEAMER